LPGLAITLAAAFDYLASHDAIFMIQGKIIIYGSTSVKVTVPESLGD